MCKYFDKGLEILQYIVSQGSRRISQIFCSSNILPVILNYCKYNSKVPRYSVTKLVRIVKNTCTPQTRQKLEELGAIESLIEVYKFLINELEKHEEKGDNTSSDGLQQQAVAVDEKLMYEVLKLLVSFCQFSPDGSEKAAINDFISLALRTMNLKNTRFDPLVLDMLVSFVTASEKARDLMWKAVNGPYVLI